MSSLARLCLPLLLPALVACGGGEGGERDLTLPVISDAGLTANPTDCQQYRRGDTIPFLYLLADNVELGRYNIEVHHNFDHHTHSTSSVDCPLLPKKEATGAWVYNRDFDIPAGLTSYQARVGIPIPAAVAPGDYHFMIRLTDRAGWQQLRSVAIRVLE